MMQRYIKDMEDAGKKTIAILKDLGFSNYLEKLEKLLLDKVVEVEENPNKHRALMNYVMDLQKLVATVTGTLSKEEQQWPSTVSIQKYICNMEDSVEKTQHAFFRISNPTSGHTSAAVEDKSISKRTCLDFYIVDLVKQESLGKSILAKLEQQDFSLGGGEEHLLNEKVVAAWKSVNQLEHDESLPINKLKAAYESVCLYVVDLQDALNTLEKAAVSSAATNYKK